MTQAEDNGCSLANMTKAKGKAHAEFQNWGYFVSARLYMESQRWGLTCGSAQCLNQNYIFQPNIKYRRNQ
jgi:hypothetical protein